MSTNLTYIRLWGWGEIKALLWAQVPMQDIFSVCAFDDSGVWSAQASEPQPLLIDLTKEMEEKP